MTFSGIEVMNSLSKVGPDLQRLLLLASEVAVWKCSEKYANVSCPFIGLLAVEGQKKKKIIKHIAKT